MLSRPTTNFLSTNQVQLEEPVSPVFCRSLDPRSIGDVFSTWALPVGVFQVHLERPAVVDCRRPGAFTRERYIRLLEWRTTHSSLSRFGQLLLSPRPQLRQHNHQIVFFFLTSPRWWTSARLPRQPNGALNFVVPSAPPNRRLILASSAVLC